MGAMASNSKGRRPQPTPIDNQRLIINSINGGGGSLPSLVPPKGTGEASVSPVRGFSMCVRKVRQNEVLDKSAGRP